MSEGFKETVRLHCSPMNRGRVAMLTGHNKRWPISPQSPLGLPGQGVPYDFVGAVKFADALGLPTDDNQLGQILIPYVTEEGQILNDENLEKLLSESDVLFAFGGSVAFGPDGSFGDPATKTRGLLSRLGIKSPFGFLYSGDEQRLRRAHPVNGIQPRKQSFILTTPMAERGFTSEYDERGFIKTDYVAVLRENNVRKSGCDVVFLVPCHGGNYLAPQVFATAVAAPKGIPPREGFFAVVKLDAMPTPQTLPDGTVGIQEVYLNPAIAYRWGG